MTDLDKIIAFAKEQHKTDINSHRGAYSNIIRYAEQLQTEVNKLALGDVSQRSELLLSAICQFTKRNTQKEIQEVERWIETDFRK